MLDVQKPSFLTVYAVPDETHLEVRGDATGLGGSGATYRVIAPPGVDSTTGALAKPENMLSDRADNPGCGYLWSGYQYIPPQVGHESGGSTTGAQPGTNKLGSYLCWNRIYEPNTGRWTTPSWPDLLAPNEWEYRWPSGQVRSWWGKLKDDLDFAQRLDAIRRAITLDEFKATRDGSCGWDEIIYREGTGRICFGVDYLLLHVRESEFEHALQEGASDKEIATSALASYLQRYIDSLVGDEIPHLVPEVAIDLKNTRAEVAAKCPSSCHLTFYRVHIVILERSVGPARFSSVAYGKTVDEREPPNPQQHKKEGGELYRLIGVRALLTISYGIYYRAICKADLEQEERFQCGGHV